jgi:hypothetical protein
MRYLHFFIDTQDNNIISHERITGRERRRRNKEAEAVGEFFLRWIPALVFILLTMEIGTVLFSFSFISFRHSD